MTGVHGITSGIYFNGHRLQSPDGPIHKRVIQKNAKYKKPVLALHCNFTALVFENISGRLSPEFYDFINSRTAIIADRTGVAVSMVRRYWTTQLSCVIRKQFAFTIQHRSERLLTRRYPRARYQDQYDQLTQRIVVSRDRPSDA